VSRQLNICSRIRPDSPTLNSTADSAYIALSAFSKPIADPNPRLQRLIDAARRRVEVRILLEIFFDEPETFRSN
jgi:hypothetical protein